MSLTQHEQTKILEGIYRQLTAHFDKRQAVLDNLHSNEPGCGVVGKRGIRGFDGFMDVGHGASCVQQMKVNIEDVEQRIYLFRNPPVPEQRMTDQQLFDRALGDVQKYGVSIVELVRGLTK